MKLTKINESFSLIEGESNELIQISDFFKVEREGAYFDPLVKRGFKSPYDFFTQSVDYKGKKALIIMNGLINLHSALNELKNQSPQYQETSEFQESEIIEFLNELEGVLPFTHYDYQRKGVIDTLTGPTKTIGRYCTGCLDGDSLIDVFVEGYSHEEIRRILDEN